MISDDIQLEKLKKELQQPDASLLQAAFATHCQKQHFHGDSGLVPHSILAVNICIDRLGAQMVFQDSEDSEDENYDME